MRLFYAAALILWTTAPTLAQDAEQNWIQTIDGLFADIVSLMGAVLFADLGTKFPSSSGCSS